MNSTQGSPTTRREFLTGIAPLVALGFALRVLAAARAPVIESDGAYYASLAAALARGDLEHGISAAWPPLLPVLGSACIRLGLLLGIPEGPGLYEMSLRIVSVLAGTLTLVAMGRLARTWFDHDVARLAVAIAAVHPRLVQFSGAALTEATFAACLVAGVAALARGRAWVSGVAMGMACLTRPEGAWIAAFLWLAGCCLGQPRSGVARLRPLFLAGFLAIALPYAIVASRQAGHVTLGEKGTYNFWRTYRVEYARHFPAPHRLVEDVNETPLVPRLGHGRQVHVAAFVMREPARVLSRSLRHLLRIALGSIPGAAYAPLFVLALIGLWRWPWREAWPLLAPLIVVPLLYAPIGDDRRFFVPLVPLLAIAAARGAASLTRWVARVRPARASSRAAAVVTFVLLAASACYALFVVGPIDDAPEHKQAGLGLRGMTASRDGRLVVMSRKPWVAFYAGGEIAELPDASPDEVLRVARAKGVHVVVIDERWAVPNRPQLAGWLETADRDQLAPVLTVAVPMQLRVYGVVTKAE